MFKALLAPDVQQFIRDHENDDPYALILRGIKIFDVPSAAIGNQIIARKKAKSKLPSYYNAEGIVFPPALNLEQSSSEQTANFKTTVIPPAATAIDLTGGFGVDSFALSKVVGHVDYVESNESLAELAEHNHHALGAHNIRHHRAKAEEFIMRSERVDLVYVDPSRRVENVKVQTLTDSMPNIVKLQSSIFEKAKYLLVKAAPMLDISLALMQLRFTKRVFVVSVDNEVKELLFFAENGFDGEPIIEAVNLTSYEPERFVFLNSVEKSLVASFDEPKRYLYEPYSSILKAGAFKSVASTFHVSKIHPNTHLYTSDKWVNHFPGRGFEIETDVKLDKNTIATYFPDGHANVLTRNYPLSPDEIKSKVNLKDGGEKFLIGFTSQKAKHVVVANRIK